MNDILQFFEDMVEAYTSVFVIILGQAKLISCSTEHQGNEVGLVSRKENMMSFPVITSSSDIKVTVLAQTIALIQAISGSLVYLVL